MFINSSFSNTALEEPRDRYPIDTIVTHECSGNGLKMNGTRTQKCLPSGEWDGTFPNCIGKNFYKAALYFRRNNILPKIVA